MYHIKLSLSYKKFVQRKSSFTFRFRSGLAVQILPHHTFWPCRFNFKCNIGIPIVTNLYYNLYLYLYFESLIYIFHKLLAMYDNNRNNNPAIK